MMAIKAAIDIGTNTVLLLVADSEGGRLNNRLELQEIPRLGRHVDSDRILSEEGMQNVIQVLLYYSSVIREKFGQIPVIVTATSAVRDAANSEDFLSRVKSETGFDIRLLSGREEAECTFTGAIAPLELPSGSSVIVVDIGGGSCELAAGRDNQLNHGLSIDMGSVRFSERYMKSDPPKPEQIDACRSAVRQSLLENVQSGMHGMDHMIAVAGTATTIAALLSGYQDTKRIPLNQGKTRRILNNQALTGNTINGMNISRSELRDLSGRLSSMNCAQILNLDRELLTGRSDIILAGILILEGVLDFFKHETFTVSSGGIRHGALLKEW